MPLEGITVATLSSSLEPISLSVITSTELFDDPIAGNSREVSGTSLPAL